MKVFIPTKTGEIDATIGDDNCIKFPERIRNDYQACTHRRVRIDSSLNVLICSDCKREVNAVAWIKDNFEYFRQVRQQTDERERRIKEDQAELERRARTRCTHCRKMTAINLKHTNIKIIQ